MGSDNGNANELPVHKVNIPSFQMAKYEVTVREYGQFIKATGYAPVGEYADSCMTWERKTENNSYGITGAKGGWNDTFIAQNDFHPVLCVNTIDIQAYIDWLSTETGEKYRLPSESEWEYAARAGTTAKYFFGDDEAELCRYGNVFDQTGQMAFKQKYSLDGTYAQCDDKAEYTTVVGMYQPNPYGLYDTLGNVGEILADCEHKTYQGAPSDGSAWTSECDSFGPNSKMQIHRGRAYGQWSEPSSLSSSSRGHIGLDLRSSLGEGFRLALDAADNKQVKQPISTIKFSKSLAIAQEQEALRRIKLTPFPTAPIGLTLNNEMNNGTHRLSWHANSEPVVTGYNIYRSETVGGKYSLLAANINTLQYTDTTLHTRKHSYVIAATNSDKTSLYSQPVTTADMVKNISLTIQAEDFNFMQGMAVGTIADKEDTGGGLNLTGDGGINKGNWTDYLINVESSGFYKLNYRIASADGSDGFELLLNDKVRATFAVPITGGWRKWQTASGEKMYIEAGQYKVRIKAIASGWKLNWFSFVES
ncbi:SUMF1/EgtB/PvdO family nonheme iron enzyme [Colwellia sp. TT2012]|uniref:SUMF1/EgtB/PvdO family nonheme iron enzyme n=1 Tax=Colwellia sp. TT2012 TaxID=1720342 RepID=UPI0018D232A3|nr:SUMF1/EgtB/PvdO family nonheme iron enzyme [Colwellia sp. TT2012]